MQGLPQYMQNTALMDVATVHIGKNKRSNFRLLCHSGGVRLNDPESYAGGSVTTDRVFHARQVKGDDPNKRQTLILQVGS